MTPGSRSLPARWMTSLVLDCTARLVDGLPEDVARDRFDEVRSDLWDQAAASDRRGRSGLRLAATIAVRTAAGIASDLQWRARTAESIRRQRRARLQLPIDAPAGGAPFDQTNGAVEFDPGSRVDALAAARDRAAASVIGSLTF